jgi:hypothetical protein
MEIKQNATSLVGDWKLQLALAAVIGVVGIALATMGPTLATVVTFFWPLVVSTVFLLSAIAVLFRISPPPSDPDHEGVPGHELMQYVAGCPDEVALQMTERLDQASLSVEGEAERSTRTEEESVKEEERREADAEAP